MPNPPLAVGAYGDDVADLHKALSRLGYDLLAAEVNRNFFGSATRQAVLEFQRTNGLNATGTVDEHTANLLASCNSGSGTVGRFDGGKTETADQLTQPQASKRVVVTTGQSSGPDITGDTYSVSGSVRSTESAGVGGLIVRLIDKNIGPDVELADTTTDSSGMYRMTACLSPATLQQRLKTQPDLQVRIFAGDTFLAASVVRYNASTFERLDVLLPAGLTALPSEYETLTATLGGAYEGKLADLQETTVQQDITYLANKTGWDARAVALAALADQFSQLTAPPSAPVQVTPVSRAAGTRQSAKAAGTSASLPAPTQSPIAGQAAPRSRIPGALSLKPEFYYALFRAGIPANADSVFQASPKMVEAVWEKAIKQGVIPQAAPSALADALQSFQALSAAHTLDAHPPIGISTLKEMLQTCLPDSARQREFAQSYVQFRGDTAALWNNLRDSLGDRTTKRLQLHGQIFYLTLNNAPLVQALNDAEKEKPLSSTLDLATRGYHNPAKWMPLIGNSIPSQIPGEGTDEQRSNYAELLAAKVRLAFPTAVVADLVRRGAFPLSDRSVEPAHVADFLDAHQGKFAVGMEPVEAYIARTKLEGTPASLIAQIKRLQRVYQMTPDDRTMAVLLQHNLDSAYAITRYDAAGFVRTFQARLGGAANAKAIHTRAKQIHGIVLNIAVAYLGARIAPTLGGQAPIHVPFLSPSADQSNSVIAYPTLESLFGSLDYCNCQECRSILSPAAYLVDLLNYLDNLSPTASYLNPQSVLFQRRPDLQYLLLTCENTNTALPYIDIVNETLEYFVANNLSLANYQGQNTEATVTSSELVATPQFVNDAAYVALQNAFSPLPLPFNRPLELLRLHLRKLGVTLSDVMETLRADDLLERSAPIGYGWRDILMEQVCISREEYRLFTDRTLGLQGLYGYPDDPTGVLQDISLQDYSRRTGVSYDDLISIIKTQFINPNAILIPRLEKLNVPFATLQQLKNGVGVPQFKAALPPDLDARQYGGQASTDYDAVVKWVTDDANFARIMSIITITDPTNSLDQNTGVLLRFRYSNPDSGNALLTATDFVKLIRFIRLWQKLGLSIAQTDDILRALYPVEFVPTDPDDNVNLAKLDSGFQVLLPRLGFLFQVLEQLTLTAETDLAPLLACWAPLGTAGDNSIYYKMFLTPTAVEAGPQTATVGGGVTEGDVLTTTINGIPIVYTAQIGDPTLVASNIVNTINGTVTIDPDSDLPLNSRIFASSDAGVITIRAGFTLECTAGIDATDTYTSVTLSPLLYTATVGGVVTVGDQLTTIVNSLPITYTVATGDNFEEIAKQITLAINDTTTYDPFSGLPLNTLVVASSQGYQITIEAVNSGAPLTLLCSLSAAARGTYTAEAPQISATTTVLGVGSSSPIPNFFFTNIDGISIEFDFPGSVDAGTVGSAIASLISSKKDLDPYTGLPLNTIVSASAVGGVVTITALPAVYEFDWVDFSVNATYAGPGTYAYFADGPVHAPQTATVAGKFPMGAVLTTTIDGVAIPYTVGSGDNETTIASNIVSAVNATTQLVGPFPGTPLNNVVSASAVDGAVTITAKPPFRYFTMRCSLSMEAATYTAGKRLSPFADDGYGNFLQDQSQRLFGHEPTLRAAFNLTGAEFTLIATELGFTPDSFLTLANISSIFRMGWLARTLRLSVPEFLSLRHSTGLDPFALLDPAATAPVEPHMIRLIRLLQALASAGLEPVQALYLMWNQDISGRLTPAIEERTALARTLRSDFAAVETQFALKDDPDGSIAKSLMALVYGAAPTDFFFGLLNKTLTTSVTLQEPAVLTSPVIEAITKASHDRFSYDNLRDQLTYGGFLDPATQLAINQAITDNGDSAPLHIALDSLASANQRAIGPFFATYNELLALYISYAVSTDPPQQRRTILLAQFLPILKQKRKAEQALATLTSAVGTDPSFAAALLQDATVLHATTDITAAAATDLMAVERQGLSVEFFLDNNPGPAPDTMFAAVALGLQTATVGGTIKVDDILTTTINGISISYTVSAADSTLSILAENIAETINSTQAIDPLTQLPLNQVISVFPNGNTITILGLNSGTNCSFSASNGANETYTAGGATPIIGIWKGYIDAPQDGFYNIYIQTDANAVVGLQIGGTQISNQSQISLKAGTLTSIVITATSLQNTLSVTWEGSGFGRVAIPLQYLYSATLVENLSSTYVRFLKAASLSKAMSLSANEIAYLGTATNLRINTRDGQDNTAPGTATFTPESMNNIVVGSLLTIDSDADQEDVTVSGITATTFSAITVKPHNGSASPFPIVGQVFPEIGRGWLNFLSQSAPPNLRDTLSAVTTFDRLKQALSPRDERLLDVLRNPSLTLLDGSLAVRSLTGWALDSLNALQQRFFGGIQLANLSSIENFGRVYDAFVIVNTCRIKALALIAATTNAPSATNIKALQSALRAHYAEADWAALVRPINDTIRIQQRDALVGYILQQFGNLYEQARVRSVLLEAATAGTKFLLIANTAGVTPGMLVQGTNIAVYTRVKSVIFTNAVMIDPPTQASLPAGSSITFVPADVIDVNTPDKLFEYFLIDVQTQPAVETSRIRLALSSVQLFIERILRNLEPSCAPSDVEDPDPNKPPRWPWMKRYRVWQANREVFLWPENWLYPELRDDQSSFFKEMMSSLLQGDITDDAAASAYIDYLTKLEAVAKLEPCGLFYVPKANDANETSYVVARTAGANRKYYFRQKEVSWSPWTEVNIECEDMPITPIVWNQRLFLFWLKVLKQTSPQTIAPGTNLGSKTSGDSLFNLSLDNLQVFAQASATAQTQGTTFQAVLCWSEFYNGKWQQTKTSDINLPTTLGNFIEGTTDANRGLWQIFPVQLSADAEPYFKVPADAIILAIKSGNRNWSMASLNGFILYNTHSVPMPCDDIWIGVYPVPILFYANPQPSRGRLLAPRQAYTDYAPDTFSIQYQANTIPQTKGDLLSFTRAPRYVEPQAGLDDAWEAPFIFEDRLYQFYVETATATNPTISMYTDFGILSATPGLQLAAPDIPRLVLAQESKRTQTDDLSQIGNTNRSLHTAIRQIRYRSPQS